MYILVRRHGCGHAVLVKKTFVVRSSSVQSPLQPYGGLGCSFHEQTMVVDVDTDEVWAPNAYWTGITQVR